MNEWNATWCIIRASSYMGGFRLKRPHVSSLSVSSMVVRHFVCSTLQKRAPHVLTQTRFRQCLWFKSAIPFVYQIRWCLQKAPLMNALCFVYVYQPIRWHSPSQEALRYPPFHHEAFTIATSTKETDTISALRTCLIYKASVHRIELQPGATCFPQL